jgi:hypothetical protein
MFNPMKKYLLILLLFISCNVSKMMQTWVGNTQQQLELKWGAPTTTSSDGASGQILIYKTWVNTGQTAGQVVPDGNGGAVYTNPQNNGYWRERDFYINSNGIVYAWRWSGY